MYKRWMTVIIALTVFLMVVPLLVACDSGNDEEETKTTQSTETTASSTESVTKTGTFKIGMINMVDPDRPSAGAYEMLSVPAINDAGGFVIGDTRYDIKLTWGATQLTTAGAVSAIQKLLNEDDVDVVGATVQAMDVQPYTEAAKKLLLGDEQTDSFTSLETPYSFRLMTPDDFHISFPVTFEWISKNRPDIKTIFYVGYAYMGDEYVKHIEESAPNFGLTMLGDNLVEIGTTDFAPVLTAVLKKNPDAIIVEQQYGASVIRQARQMGYEGTFILNSSMPTAWFKNLTLEELEGIISMTPDFTSGLVPQWLKDIWQAMAEGGGVQPAQARWIKTYLRPYILIAVAKAAGSTTDCAKMKEVLENETLHIELPTGTVDMKTFGKEQYGYNCQILIHSPFLSVIQNGKHEIVYAPTLEELTALQSKAYPEHYE